MNKKTIRLTESALHKIIKESINMVMNEAFRSNTLRDWFKEHGGVKRVYGDDEADFNKFSDKRVRQDALGDISDDCIVYRRECDSFKDAYDLCWDLNHPKDEYSRKRMPFNQKTYYTIYQARDGKCLVVGIDKTKIESESSCIYGDISKKLWDRKFNNGWNYKTNSDRYVDDSDTYYYTGKARDFGLKTNSEYDSILNWKKDLRKRMSDDEWKEYQKNRVSDMRDYVDRHYKR
jgi:hypothetical protein